MHMHFKLICLFQIVQCGKLDNSDDHSSRTSRLLIDQNDRFLQIEKQLQDMRVKIINLENENMQLKANGGAVFIRWGRKDCPALNGTQLLYSGMAGGGAYHETGSGTTNLCLPHNPDPVHAGFPKSVFSGWHSNVYGAEYQYSDGSVQIDDDAPCAVCLDITAMTSIMIPAKSTCLDGWRKQYAGNLCANYYKFPGASEYACVDQNPQYFEGKRQNQDGKLWYPAISQCGSLSCPPYEQAKYMPCVVCTK